MMASVGGRAATACRRSAARFPRGGLLLVGAAALAGCEQTVVSTVQVTAVEVSPSSITLAEGDQVTLSAVVMGPGGRELSARAVTWSVDDPLVATVDSAGVVEARAPGSTRIVAVSEGVQGSAEVSVTPGPALPPDDCTLLNRIIDDDVEIAENQSCTFLNVRIRGDLKIRRGATLTGAEVRVDGNVEAGAAKRLALDASRVDGGVGFQDGGSLDLRRTIVRGNVQFESNDGSLHAEDNRIDSNLQVFDNRGGPFDLHDNRIDGNLQCKDNDPAPTGGQNNVKGNKEDQCSNL